MAATTWAMPTFQVDFNGTVSKKMFAILLLLILVQAIPTWIFK
jgi:hypothetical protein